MSPFSAFSEFATRSTLYKRHETRNNSHDQAQQQQQPLHQHHHPIDLSIGETLSNLTKRSTIFSHHDVHHQEMHHDPHAGQRHMMANSMSKQNSSLFSTLARMTSESSIYDRNVRRNQFLHNEQ